MDNDKLDELERRVEQWSEDTDGRSYIITCDEILALITAARRPEASDAALDAEGEPYTAAQLKDLLASRDDFLVSRGLFSEYADSLPTTPPAARRPALPDREAVAKVIDPEAFKANTYVYDMYPIRRIDALAKADAILAMLLAAPKETPPRNQWIPMAPATTHNITIPEFPKVTI